MHGALAMLIACFTLVAQPVWAHPHGSATCRTHLIFTGARVTSIEISLELDAEHSRAVFLQLKAAADGSFAAEQATWMSNNLHRLFAPLNYLVTLHNSAGNDTKEIALRASSAPTLERTAQDRLRINAQLTRTVAASYSDNENTLNVHCSDPSWNWLVGFKEVSQATSNRTSCKPTLGRAFVFAPPSNIPSGDGSSINLTTEHLPTSQDVSIRCSE